MLVLFLDTLMRGVAIGGFLATSLVLLTSRRPNTTLLLGAALFLCAIFHVIDNAPGWRIISPNRRDIFWFASLFATPLFWAFVMAVFEDRLPKRIWQATLFAYFGLIMPLMVIRYVTQSDICSYLLWTVHNSISVALVCHLVWKLIAGINGDLVEVRRKLRAPAVLISCSYIIGLAIADTFDGFYAATPKWPLLQSSALALMALSSVLAFLQAGPIFWGRSKALENEEPGPPKDTSVGMQDPIDAALLQRLKAAMTVDELWRKEGLNIATLASTLIIPEYRLRRLINESLGYRNFADFINSHRINVAKVVLADPAKATLPVSQLAYELGFATLGPFNRAFKQVTSYSPTEWRAKSLADISNGSS